MNLSEQLQLEVMGNHIVVRLAQQDNILVMHGIDDVIQTHLLPCFTPFQRISLTATARFCKQVVMFLLSTRG